MTGIFDNFSLFDGPVKKLVQFIFKRLCGEYLKSSIDLGDLRKGLCNLKNLEFNA